MEESALPIIFHMLPGVEIDLETFRREAPPCSVALDGIVPHTSVFLPEERIRIFDHHKGPPRPDMLSTGSQVLRAVRMGLLEDFMRTPDEDMHVWRNDPDQDVCLADYALRHPSMVKSFVNPAVHRLYGHVDVMDMSCGLWPIPRDIPIVTQAAWVFDPYWQYRVSGALDQGSAIAHESIIADVGQRIGDFIAGNGKTVPYDDRFEEHYVGHGWIVITEAGQHARMRVTERGFRAFVSARQRPDRRWIYTICRFSPHIWWFPVPEIAAFLNLEEESDCQFGGGDIVYGNARGRGSVRAPDQIVVAINVFLREHQLLHH